jgi:sterol desaturase/sphingolipid hydroxylase (fatty acid hydroxylase superfamily)
MGFLEHILVTPSHHRVHHAIHPEYIDKNHSQIFIVWDKLFNTFQEELEAVPPVLVLQDQHKPGIQYGLTFNI